MGISATFFSGIALALNILVCDLLLTFSPLLPWTREWTMAHVHIFGQEQQILSKDIEAGAERYRGSA